MKGGYNILHPDQKPIGINKIDNGIVNGMWFTEVSSVGFSWAQHMQSLLQPTHV